MNMCWYPLMRSMAVAAAVAIPTSATIAYAQEAPPRAQSVEDRLTPGDRTEFGYGEGPGLSEYEGDPPPAGPVYERDAQGRPFFRDAIGRTFTYSDRGRWVEVQPGQTEQQLAESNAQRMARRPKLGARIEDADRGVRIVEVVQGSPADQAGLQPGDILLSVGGEQAENATQLARRIRGMEAGKEIDMTVLRDGSENQLTATLSRIGQQDRQRVARPAIEGAEQTSVAQLRQEVEELKQEVQRLKQLHGESADTDEQKQAEEKQQQAEQKQQQAEQKQQQAEQKQQQAEQQQAEQQKQAEEQQQQQEKAEQAQQQQQDAQENTQEQPASGDESKSGSEQQGGQQNDKAESGQDKSDSGEGSN